MDTKFIKVQPIFFLNFYIVTDFELWMIRKIARITMLPVDYLFCLPFFFKSEEHSRD